MGLAASQARLLSITQRLSDNELRAQLINNQKMRLSAESSQVSENYINALNKTKFMFANYDANDKAQTVPLTFNNLTAFNQYNNQYGLVNTAGNILISEDTAKKYVASGGKQEEFLKQYGIEYTTSYWDKISSQLGDAGITYSADQLKIMYEGDPAHDIMSYENTIKTQEYTDFSGYLDDFVRAKGDYDVALDRATQAAVKGIGDKQYTIAGGQHTLNGIISEDATFLFKNNATNLKDILRTVLNDNCRPGSNVTEFINSHFDTAGSDYIEITSDSAGTTFTTKSSYTELGLNATDPSSELTYTNGVDTYIRIGVVNNDENGSGSGSPIYGWVKTSDLSLPAMNQDLKIYQKDSSGNMSVVQDKDENGNTQDMVIASKSGSASDFKYKMEIEYTDASRNTQKAYPETRIKTTGTTADKIEVTTSGDKNAMSEEISAALNKIMVDAYNFLKANMNDVDASSITDQTIQDALNLCIQIGQNLLNTIIGTNEDGSNKETVTQANIDELYNYIEDVVNGQKGSTDPCLGVGPTEGFKNVINAYILDTVMDIFGEPVYTYLKEDPKINELVDANAEAKWLINLFEKINSSGYQVIAKGLANSTEWLQFALENGIVVMEQVTQEENWQGITYTSCSDISEQTANNEVTIAEAEYNKAMRQIQAKDERFDLELKNIDTEHSSLQSEYESVKKAMSGNIERNFQMYS